MLRPEGRAEQQEGRTEHRRNKQPWVPILPPPASWWPCTLSPQLPEAFSGWTTHPAPQGLLGKFQDKAQGKRARGRAWPCLCPPSVPFLIPSAHTEQGKGAPTSPWKLASTPQRSRQLVCEPERESAPREAPNLISFTNQLDGPN